MEIWVYNQYNDEREVVKVAKDDVTIGRDESNDVTLRSHFVSRHHARVFLESGSYFLESLGMNGTSVANRIIAYRQRGKIDYGDEIKIGEYSLYMMEPAQRRISVADRAVSPRKRVMDIEQTLHADLLERLNLRVTGQSGVADEKLVALIKRHLSEIIDRHYEDVDEEMSAHLVRDFLWRAVVTETTRRSRGWTLSTDPWPSTIWRTRCGSTQIPSLAIVA